MYELFFREKLLKQLAKIRKKDPILYKAVLKKGSEICANPMHYKNLNAPFSKYRRVHINANFVLCFYIEEEAQRVVFAKLAHHDEAYQY